MKKLNLNISNFIKNEDVLELMNGCITEYDVLSRNWTYSLIKKYLVEPDFKFINILEGNKETNLYFAPKVLNIEDSPEFIKEYTQFDIREQLEKLGHEIRSDFNTAKCIKCDFFVTWSRRKVQFTEPEIDYNSMTCNEMIIKKLLE